MFRYIAYGFINLFLFAVVIWALLFLGAYINGLVVGDRPALLALLLLMEAALLNAVIYALNRWFVTIIAAMKNEHGTALRTAIVSFVLSVGLIVLMLLHWNTRNPLLTILNL